MELNNKDNPISRRDFLKMLGITAASYMLSPIIQAKAESGSEKDEYNKPGFELLPEHLGTVVTQPLRAPNEKSSNNGTEVKLVILFFEGTRISNDLNKPPLRVGNPIKLIFSTPETDSEEKGVKSGTIIKDDFVKDGVYVQDKYLLKDGNHIKGIVPGVNWGEPNIDHHYRELGGTKYLVINVAVPRLQGAPPSSQNNLDNNA